MDIEHWPAWMYGPSGQSAIFEREEDVPKGWRDHPFPAAASPEAKQDPFDHDGNRKPGGSVSGGSGEEIKELRAAYKEKFGKKPFGGWDEVTLREKLGR